MYARRIADIQAKGYHELLRDKADAAAVRDAEKMSAVELSRMLCSAGPVNCRRCGLCAYGREYEKRFEEEFDGSAITREEFMKKYGANGHDANFVLHNMRPIGQTKARHPSKLYNEQRAAKALAGVWRGRAANYTRNADEWMRRAEEAEKTAGIGE